MGNFFQESLTSLLAEGFSRLRLENRRDLENFLTYPHTKSSYSGFSARIRLDDTIFDGGSVSFFSRSGHFDMYAATVSSLREETLRRTKERPQSKLRTGYLTGLNRQFSKIFLPTPMQNPPYRANQPLRARFTLKSWVGQ